MQICIMDRKVLVLDELGELLDIVEVKDVTSHTLGKLARLCESEIIERDTESWKQGEPESGAHLEGIVATDALADRMCDHKRVD